MLFVTVFTTDTYMKKHFLLLALFIFPYILPASAQVWIGGNDLDKPFLLTANIIAPVNTQFDKTPETIIAAAANTDIATTDNTADVPAISTGLKAAFNTLKFTNTNTHTLYLPFENSVRDADLQNRLLQKIAVNLDYFKELMVAATIDTLNRNFTQQKTSQDVTTLKQQVALVTNDTIKASLYQQIANYYLRYDSIAPKKLRQAYQDAAIDFTIKAIHAYSRYNDTPGLRTSFDNLVRVYKDQKKYPQAKWFVLQSNTMAREQKDVPSIISTLLELSNIKMAIKDYSLAMQDLNEAVTLAKQNRLPKQESQVQESYAVLYDKMDKPAKAIEALKRHDAIEDSITKAADATRLAAIKAQDSTRLAAAKTQDSTQQAKKKLYTSAGKKASKNTSLKKTASL